MNTAKLAGIVDIRREDEVGMLTLHNVNVEAISCRVPCFGLFCIDKLPGLMAAQQDPTMTFCQLNKATTRLSASSA